MEADTKNQDLSVCPKCQGSGRVKGRFAGIPVQITCNRCKGSGEDPWHHRRQREIERIADKFNERTHVKEDKKRMIAKRWQGEDDEDLLVNINTRDLATFLSLIRHATNEAGEDEYHPRLTGSYEYVGGKECVELLFSPHD